MAQKILDGLLSKNQYQYSKEYPGQGGKIYFNTYQIYNRSIDQAGNIDSGTLETFQLVLKGNTWYKGARLGEDGKWYSLSEKESGIYVPPNDVTKPGTFNPIPNATDSLVLGSPVIRDLNAAGRTSLRYQAINNAKFQLKKAGGLSENQVNTEFDVSNNITPPGNPGTPSLLGPSVSADSGTPPTAPNLPSPELLEQFNTPSESKIISTGSGLRYPLDTATTDQDVIKFQALEFVNRGLGSRLPESSGGVFTIPEPETRNATGPGGKSEGPVFIAIQSPISDQNSVEWGSGNISAINAAMFNVSLPLVLSDDESAKTNTKNIYKDLNNQTNRIQKFLAGEAASINNILARTDNVALNPNLELLFQGPQLRPFNFQFKMSARDLSEANTIKSIIKYFKYHMAVRKETGLFLKAPHVFRIEYLHKKNIKHPGINEIKRCALTNCSVDYTPLGSYATYEDGTMVSYTLSLQFQELVPIYDDDYKDHSIGF